MMKHEAHDNTIGLKNHRETHRCFVATLFIAVACASVLPATVLPSITSSGLETALRQAYERGPFTYTMACVDLVVGTPLPFDPSPLIIFPSPSPSPLTHPSCASASLMVSVYVYIKVFIILSHTLHLTLLPHHTPLPPIEP
jgi:hypothetical protein